MMLGLLTVLSCLAVVTRALEGDECRFGSGVGVCVGFTTCGPVLKHIQARISICNYTPREAVVCCPVDYRSQLQKIRQQADALSVSMRKCKEYQRPATVYLSSLKPNAEVVQKQAKQCSNDNKLIIGGEAAKWAEFPHMAALGYRDDPNEPIQYKCGGSLISDHFVLTAAHCIGQSLTTVRLGSLNLLSSATHEYEVEDMFSHPQYSAKSKHNDIALVKTFEKVPFSAEVRPACLYQTANVAEQKLTASGYGARENSLHEMIERQTKENLKAVMEHEFDKFKILRKQLLTVAHDNGANMVASVKLLKRLVDEGDDDHGPSVGSTVQKEKAMIDAYLNTCSNEDVEYDLDDENEQPWIDEGGEMSADDLDTDSDHDINDVNEVEDEEIIEMHLIESTRCAAHTAQLAVWDVLKQYKGRLAKINQVCIKMRHKEFQQLFHIHKYPLPPKVNETRWNVWYIVLKYLLDLRISPFLPTLEKTDASLDLSRQWLFIERFCTAFEPLFELTLRLQKDHVPLSQFYADWLICQAKLDGIKEGNVLAAKLLKTMQNRIRKLSSTKIFKASLYLDPRFNFIGSKRLSPDDKKEAQTAPARTSS